MKNDKELYFVDNSNYQNLQTAPNQNYAPVPNYAPDDGSPSSKLINTKMVRIRYGTKCSMEECTADKLYFQINTISRIDDLNPQNENEAPLFEAELKIPMWCPEPAKFNFIDALTKQPFSVSRLDGYGNKHTSFCCGESYVEFPNMIHNKIGNTMETSVTKCYDSRSFYRTFEYQGGVYYKI